MTDGEQRIELQLEGFRSVVSGGFLALSQAMTSVVGLLKEIRAEMALQNKLLAQQHNGHRAEGDTHVEDAG